MAVITNVHIDRCPPNGGYSIPYNSGEGFVCPTVGFLKFLMADFVVSSTVGPSLDSILPRTILPMEVIMVSRYTNPRVSSFTTQLELMLKRPGLDTIPMDIVPTGISQFTP